MHRFTRLRHYSLSLILLLASTAVLYGQGNDGEASGTQTQNCDGGPGSLATSGDPCVQATSDDCTIQASMPALVPVGTKIKITMSATKDGAVVPGTYSITSSAGTPIQPTGSNTFGYLQIDNPADVTITAKFSPTDGGECEVQQTVTFFEALLAKQQGNFAPGVEEAKFNCVLKPDGTIVSYAKMEAFGSNDTTTYIYQDDGADVNKEGDTPAVYDWDGTGTIGGEERYVGPEHSPYTMRYTTSTSAQYAAADSSDADVTVAVNIKSMTTTLNGLSGDLKVFMNDPAAISNVVTTVKIEKSDGTGVLAPIPVEVFWKFDNSGHTKATDSYEYTTGKTLGKRDDTNAKYWVEHTKSDDFTEWGLMGTSKTQTAGADKGIAYISLALSGVGGDEYVVSTNGVNRTTPPGTLVNHAAGSKWTVWRSTTFTSIYDMNAAGPAAVNSTEAKVQPKFNSSFVHYTAPAGGVTAVTDAKYIGLWKNDGTHQQSWATIKALTAAETPTAQELADANSTNQAVQDAARDAITAKAQAWVNRIDLAMYDAWDEWLAHGRNGNAFPGGSIVGMKHYHPKYNPSQGDHATTYWPAWVRVDTYLGSYHNVDPDAEWTGDGTGFTGLSMGGNIITVSAGSSDPLTTIVHETGHATRNSFKRADFGTSLDHSAAAGLMDETSTQTSFSPAEVKILRGIKP